MWSKTNNWNTRQNQNNWQQPRQQKKRSGCKMKIGTNNKTVYYGWNYSRKYGLVTFVATMKNEKNSCVNAKGEQLLIYVVSLQIPMQQKQTFTGFLNPNDGKLRIPDLGLVANPKAPNGGYFGKMKVSK